MKTSLQFLCNRFDGIIVSHKKLQDALLEMKKSNDTMNKRIDQQESKLQAKDDYIERLAKSLDILEMHSKKNNVIMDIQARRFTNPTSGNDPVEANGTSSQSGGEFTSLRKKVAESVNKTRITYSSTTLMDNIFTNELRFNLTSGIIFNDISDHLQFLYNL